MERPAKPRPDFPLFAHSNGQWAKKIQGKLHYFGVWHDPQSAEDNYYRQKVELEGSCEAKHKQSKSRREKPKKPRPDYPLPSGQWACKFGRQTKYFGPWDDPDGAERAYQDYASHQCTKPVRNGKVGKSVETPRKPRKNFPLWAHPAGQWARKINGNTYYFGRWADPDQAEERYNSERDDLIAGRIPRERQPGGCTVQTLCEKFLEQKRGGLLTGEIGQRSIDDYERTYAKIARSFGEKCLVEDLKPDDFARLRAEFAGSYGAVRLGNEVIRVRCVFKFAFDWGIDCHPSPLWRWFQQAEGGRFEAGKTEEGQEDVHAGADPDGIERGQQANQGNGTVRHQLRVRQ